MLSWRFAVLLGVMILSISGSALSETPAPPGTQPPARREVPQAPARKPDPHRAGKRAVTGAAPVSLPVPPIPPSEAEQAAAPRPSTPVQDVNKGSVTGLPLPRYASLRADAVNLRAGPGTRYPIDWVYKRVGMPVEILREFDVWRLVETPDGQKGWMHEATLVARRDLIITGERQILRAEPKDTAHAVAKLEPGVIGRIRSCAVDAAWCRVQIGEYRGWLPRTAFWGVAATESVSP